jgi:UDP:flavonoid glycosyltransferase YjiC (YdhE family)
MSRIVVTTIGSLGDLHPKIAIALELRQRGHDVVFATHQEYQDNILDNAARVERLGTSRTIARQQYFTSRIVKELAELLENPNYRTKAAEIGSIIQSENSVVVGCDAIEKQL